MAVPCLGESGLPFVLRLGAGLLCRSGEFLWHPWQRESYFANTQSAKRFIFAERKPVTYPSLKGPVYLSTYIRHVAKSLTSFWSPEIDWKISSYYKPPEFSQYKQSLNQWCRSRSEGSLIFWASRIRIRFYHQTKIVRKALIPTVL